MSTIVAFQGEAGAYSHQACRQHFGDDVQTLACNSFQDTFAAVHSGKATHIMLPVENAVAGTVTTATDVLADYDLRIQGEALVPVRHCLLAPKGTRLHDVTRVLSHWQALAQCAETLRRMNIEPVNHYDTAGAARDLAANPEPNTASISSELAGELYGLEVLARDMQDRPYNTTRFSVVGIGDVPRGEFNKTSIVFTTRSDTRPGALVRVLNEFASRDINMTKIESRPRTNVAWQYRFFVDIDGHEDDEIVRDALTGVLRHSSMLKVLGSYPVKRG
ncbi:MAG: prephenate dehydratase [Candidatus Promineifilaceae bacterium]